MRTRIDYTTANGGFVRWTVVEFGERTLRGNMDGESPTTGVSRAGAASIVMWLLAVLLTSGVLGLVVTELPGRAKPLFLLAAAFGLTVAAIASAVRRSLQMPPGRSLRMVTVLIALGAYAAVIAAAYREFRDQANASHTQQDGTALIALEMLENSTPEDRELAERLRADLEGQSADIEAFLDRRYAALSSVRGRFAVVALTFELILVAGAAFLGGRFLDARAATRQA